MRQAASPSGSVASTGSGSSERFQELVGYLRSSLPPQQVEQLNAVLLEAKVLATVCTLHSGHFASCSLLAPMCTAVWEAPCAISHPGLVRVCSMSGVSRR